MKRYLFIVNVLLALVLVKSDMPVEIKKLHDECTKEVGLTDFKGPPESYGPKQKCFYACIFEKHGTLVNGTVVVEKALEFLAKNSTEKITDVEKANVKECASKANEEEEDKCDVAEAVQKCMTEFSKLDRKDEAQFFAECGREIGVTENLGELKDENPKKWCVRACVIKKRGGIVNGKAITEKIIEIFCKDMHIKPTDSVKAAITGCVDEANKSTNECQMFKVIRTCIREKNLNG